MWRKFMGKFICTTCLAIMQKKPAMSRYRVDPASILHVKATVGSVTTTELASRMGLFTAQLYDLESGAKTIVTSKLLKKIRVNFPDFKATPIIKHVAPANLKRLREKAEWTQKDAAEFLGIGIPEYQYIEKGGKQITPGFLDELIEEIMKDIK
jgi:transcriptional regulator with XRE-family HTH domain